jgi:hypothetical protein
MWVGLIVNAGDRCDGFKLSIDKLNSTGQQALGSGISQRVEAKNRSPLGRCGRPTVSGFLPALCGTENACCED